jgi:hypothetical protein
MNNRKSIIAKVGVQTQGWNVDLEIGHDKSREVGYLVPKNNDINPMYEYWREQKIPWAECRVSLLKKAVELTANMQGLYLDFGTLTGNVIKVMSSLLPNNIIYGFDSYKGYPEEFGVQSKGAWGIPIPTNFPSNTKLVVGLFQDTLYDFLKEKQQKINIIHIDCDLYDSTKCVLDECYSYMQIGTVVQFNGLFNRNVIGDTLYWFNDELTAWNDFVKEKNIDWSWIGSQGFSASMLIKKLL